MAGAGEIEDFGFLDLPLSFSLRIDPASRFKLSITDVGEPVVPNSDIFLRFSAGI